MLGFQPFLAPELAYGKAVHHVMRAIAQHTRDHGTPPSASELDRLFDVGSCQRPASRRTNSSSGQPVVSASVFKVAVALEVFRQASAGRLDPARRVRVDPADATPGPTGISVFADQAELSVRDLALLMLSVSDNAASDVLIGLVGLDALNGTLGELGLTGTVVPVNVAGELDWIGQDAGFAGYADLVRRGESLSPEEERHAIGKALAGRAFDPYRTIRMTARETAAWSTSTC